MSDVLDIVSIANDARKERRYDEATHIVNEATQQDPEWLAKAMREASRRRRAREAARPLDEAGDDE